MGARAEQREWRCRECRLSLAAPLLMGVVNVTPDSFSDGGLWLDPASAVRHGLELVEEGADLLDIGGESTRPGALPVSAEEELRRVLPVLRGLSAQCKVPLSIDTRHAAVARAAVGAGACIVNDVMPGTRDDEMMRVVRETGAGLVLMHARGTPQTMAQLTAYGDVVGEVASELELAVARAVEMGVARDRLVVDPGIGFAKTTPQNVALLAALGRFSRIAPVLIGTSRKRFLGDLCAEPDARRRLGASVGAAVWCAKGGASILRVHDVRETRQALAVFGAIEEVAGRTHV